MGSSDGINSASAFSR